MTKIIDNTNLGYLISKIKAAFWPKTDVVQIGLDDTPVANSNNLVKSGGVKSALDEKQDEINSNNKLEYSLISNVPTNVSSFTNDINYVKYVLCADETAYNAISSKDSGTLYLIPKT